MTDAAIKWKALESNPEVLTAFSRKLGLPEHWAIGDIFGLDEDLLGFVPQPCLAVLLLIPCTTKTPDTGSSDHGQKLFYMKQPDALGNACGTIALFHAFANHMEELGMKGGALASWLDSVKDMTPEQRGDALNSQEDLNDLHNSSAVQGATEVKVEGVEHHFICFTSVDGHLFELDGRKSGPVCHGEIKEASMLHAAAKVIKEAYIAPNPDLCEFAMMSLAPAQ